MKRYYAKNPLILARIAAVSAILLLLGGCDWLKPVPLSKEEQEVRSALSKKLDAKVESVAVRDLTSFEWDKVCYMSPYMSKDEADARIGFSYKDFHKYNWPSDDTIWGLLFADVKRKKVTTVRIQSIMVSQVRGGVKCAMKDNATFKIKYINDKRWGSLAELILIEN